MNPILALQVNNDCNTSIEVQCNESTGESMDKLDKIQNR